MAKGSQELEVGAGVVVGARFEVEVESLDESAAIARVQGEIDMSTTPELMDRLLPAAESGPPGLVIDLSAVAFMGAAGLHVLEELQSALRHRGGELAVVATGGIPLRVLEVTRMAERFPVEKSIAAARSRLA